MRVRDVTILVYCCADLLCSEAKAPGSRYAGSIRGDARPVEGLHDSHRYRHERSKTSNSTTFSEGESPYSGTVTLTSGDASFESETPDCSNGYEGCLPPSRPHGSKKGGHVPSPGHHDKDVVDDLHSKGNSAEKRGTNTSSGTANSVSKKRSRTNVKASHPTRKSVPESESESEGVKDTVGSKTKAAADSDSDFEAKSEESGEGSEEDSVGESESEPESNSEADSKSEPESETESESEADSNAGTVDNYKSKPEDTVYQQSTNTSKSDKTTIGVVPGDSSAPLGLLEHHSYYPSHVRSKECKKLVDAVITDDLIELNKQLADFVDKKLDVPCIQAVLHTAMRNHQQHALWMLTDYFSERLTPPMMDELEPLLSSELIKSENAYSYWSRLPVPDSIKASKLKLLLEKLSEPAFIQFVALWNASKYGSKALGDALSGMSDRRTMLAQLVVRRVVKWEAKCIKTLSTRVIAALINVRRMLAEGSGTTEEDFKVLYGGIKNLEKAIMSDLPSIVDLAMRVEPERTKTFLQQKIIPQAENLTLKSFLRVLAYTDRKDHNRLPTMTLYPEAKIGRELHSKLLSISKVEDVCNTQKVVDIDALLPAELYNGMTTSAKDAFVVHIVMMVFGIHPTIQSPLNGTLSAAQEVQQKIDAYCNRPQAAKVKFPKVN